MTLYLTRHGETAENAAGLVQGRGLDPDLNDVGRAQAVALAERLAQVPLAAVVTSTQKRSQQTAEPVLATHRGAALLVRAGIDE
ncbi:MAG TPA: histidine phosphatase family protein, partial [Rubricoccaceae bacterium]